METNQPTPPTTATLSTPSPRKLGEELDSDRDHKRPRLSKERVSPTSSDEAPGASESSLSELHGSPHDTTDLVFEDVTYDTKQNSPPTMAITADSVDAVTVTLDEPPFSDFPFINGDMPTAEKAAKALADATQKARGKIDADTINKLMQWLELESPDPAAPHIDVFIQRLDFWRHIGRTLLCLSRSGNLDALRVFKVDDWKRAVSVILALSQVALQAEAELARLHASRRDSVAPSGYFGYQFNLVDFVSAFADVLRGANNLTSHPSTMECIEELRFATATFLNNDTTLKCLAGLFISLLDSTSTPIKHRGNTAWCYVRLVSQLLVSLAGASPEMRTRKSFCQTLGSLLQKANSKLIPDVCAGRLNDVSIEAQKVFVEDLSTGLEVICQDTEGEMLGITRKELEDILTGFAVTVDAEAVLLSINDLESNRALVISYVWILLHSLGALRSERVTEKLAALRIIREIVMNATRASPIKKDQAAAQILSNTIAAIGYGRVLVTHPTDARVLHQAKDIIDFLAYTHNFRTEDRREIWTLMHGTTELSVRNACFDSLSHLIKTHLQPHEICHLISLFDTIEVDNVWWCTAHLFEVAVNELANFNSTKDSSAAFSRIVNTLDGLIYKVFGSRQECAAADPRDYLLTVYKYVVDKSRSPRWAADTLSRLLPNLAHRDSRATATAALLSQIVYTDCGLKAATDRASMIQMTAFTALQDFCAAYDGKQEDFWSLSDYRYYLVFWFASVSLGTSASTLMVISPKDLWSIIAGPLHATNTFRTLTLEAMVHHASEESEIDRMLRDCLDECLGQLPPSHLNRGLLAVSRYFRNTVDEYDHDRMVTFAGHLCRLMIECPDSGMAAAFETEVVAVAFDEKMYKLDGGPRKLQQHITNVCIDAACNASERALRVLKMLMSEDLRKPVTKKTLATNRQSTLTEQRHRSVDLPAGTGPRSVIEEVVFSKYWTLYDLLYDRDDIAEAAFKVLGRINIPEVLDVIQKVYIDKMLDPQFPSARYKTQLANNILIKAYQNMAVKDQSFLKTATKALFQIIAQDSENEPRLLAPIARTLGCFLKALFDERELEECFTNVNFVKILTAHLFAFAHHPNRGFVLGALLDCLFVAAAATEINLRAVIEEENVSDDLLNLLNQRETCSAVAGALVTAVQNLPDTTSQEDERVPARLDRGKRLKLWIFRLLWKKLSSHHDGSASPDEVLSVLKAKSECLAVVASWELNHNNLQGSINEVLQLLYFIATRETFCGDQLEYAIAHVCTMLRSCGWVAQKLGSMVVIQCTDVEALFNLLFWDQDTMTTTKLNGFPLHDQTCRTFAYEMLSALFHARHDILVLSTALNDVLDNFSNRTGFIYQGRESSLRDSNAVVGLDNLGQTCYLNSIVQQLFMNINFRRFLLETPVTDPDTQAPLVEFRRTFEFLQSSWRSAMKPDGLARVLGVNIGVQEDAQLFFTMLMSMLEESMPDAESKKQLESFFKGRNITMTKGECEHISTTTDEYVNLCLAVKNRRNLLDSLNDYVSGERLDEANRFHCSKCEEEGKPELVEAFRRTRLEHIPDNLVIGLNRFECSNANDASKINDRFSFPAKLDMGPFKIDAATHSIENLPPDQFELVGVVVHQGSLSFGHYWSCVKDHKSYGEDPGTWLRVEDAASKPTTLELVLEETNGTPWRGQNGVEIERSDNAYILFYRRLSPPQGDDGIQVKHTSEPDTIASVAGNVVEDDNIRARLETYLHEASCYDFILDLMSKPTQNCRCSICKNDSGERTVTLAAKYLLKIMAHQTDLGKVDKICSAIEDQVDDGLLASDLLRIICSEELVEHWLFANTRIALRINKLVLKLLESMRDDEPEAYGCAFESPGDEEKCMLIHVTKLLCSRKMGMSAWKWTWSAYFRFFEGLALLGPVESRVVAESDALNIAICMLYARSYESLRSGSSNIIVNEPNKTVPLDVVISYVNFTFTHLLKYDSKLTRGSEIQDEWSPEYSSRLYTTSEQAEMIARVDGDRIPAILRSTCRPCPIAKEQDVSLWPPSALMLTLCGEGGDTKLRYEIIQLLGNALVACSELVDFRRYLMVAEALCRSSIIPDKHKILLFDTALEESYYNDDFATCSMDFVEAVIERMPVPNSDGVLKWTLKILCGKDTDATRYDMLRFLQKHCFRSQIEDERKLTGMLTSLDFVLRVVTGTFSTTRPQSRPVSGDQLRYASAAFKDGIAAIRTHHAEFLDSALDPLRLQRRLTALGWTTEDADREANQLVGKARVFYEVEEQLDGLLRWAKKNHLRLHVLEARAKPHAASSSGVEVISSDDDTEMQAEEGEEVWTTDEVENDADDDTMT